MITFLQNNRQMSLRFLFRHLAACSMMWNVMQISSHMQMSPTMQGRLLACNPRPRYSDFLTSSIFQECRAILWLHSLRSSSGISIPCRIPQFLIRAQISSPAQLLHHSIPTFVPNQKPRADPSQPPLFPITIPSSPRLHHEALHRPPDQRLGRLGNLTRSAWGHEPSARREGFRIDRPLVREGDR